MGYTVILKKNDNGDYLVHHGIKGQKWGVRRYQNADGSLTAAGEKRQQRAQRRSERKEMYRTMKQLWDEQDMEAYGPENIRKVKAARFVRRAGAMTVVAAAFYKPDTRKGKTVKEFIQLSGALAWNLAVLARVYQITEARSRTNRL